MVMMTILLSMTNPTALHPQSAHPWVNGRRCLAASIALHR